MMFKSMRQNGITKGTDREHKWSMEGGFRHSTSGTWLDGNEQLMVGRKQKMYTMQDMKKVDFPGGSDSALPRQEAQVRSLVKELRSHISHSQKKEKAF